MGGGVMARRRTIGRSVVALCSLVACGVATAGAAAHSAAHNKAAARHAAARLLRSAVLPAGAARVRTDPEAPTGFDWLQGSDPGTPFASNVVDLHAFFRVPGDPATVYRRLREPHGSTLATSFHFHVHGRTDARSVSFAFRVTGDPLTQRGLAFQLTAAAGGGTAVRVEAWAGWLVPRPAFERVPHGIHAVAVSLDGSRTTNFPITTITDPASVAKLVQYVDSLQLVQPDSASSCDSSQRVPRIDVRFMPAVGAAPVARVTGDGCAGLNFAVNGRRGPTLAVGSTDLGDALWRLHAVPVCAPGQLSGSVVPPDPSSSVDPANGMLLHLTNVSGSVCGLKGFPGIQLRGADGRPLLARTLNLDLFTHAAILAPNTFATIELGWGEPGQCHGTSVTSIDVLPPGLASAVSIAVGSRKPPVDPCHRAISVSPVEAAGATLG